ncbi:hypothetical protein D3C73_1501330 [compost metagenome]
MLLYFRRDAGTGYERSADRQSCFAGNGQNAIKGNGFAFACRQLFHEEHIAFLDLVLLAAGFNNCVHWVAPPHV